MGKFCYLRNFGVTTFHFPRPLHVIEPVLYLTIVSADCDDDRRIDYFVHAKNKEHKKKREILNYHHVWCGKKCDFHFYCVLFEKKFYCALVDCEESKKKRCDKITSHIVRR